MPNSGLSIGPYGLTAKNIDTALTKTAPGAYALGRVVDNKFYVDYVGRSDTDLVSRLKQHATAGIYVAFKANYTTSAKSAFEWECRMFHDFSGLDNAVHPARPAKTDWKCPRCTTFD